MGNGAYRAGCWRRWRAWFSKGDRENLDADDVGRGIVDWREARDGCLAAVDNGRDATEAAVATEVLLLPLLLLRLLLLLGRGENRTLLSNDSPPRRWLLLGDAEYDETAWVSATKKALEMPAVSSLLLLCAWSIAVAIAVALRLWCVWSDTAVPVAELLSPEDETEEHERRIPPPSSKCSCSSFVDADDAVVGKPDSLS